MNTKIAAAALAVAMSFAVLPIEAAVPVKQDQALVLKKKKLAAAKAHDALKTRQQARLAAQPKSQEALAAKPRVCGSFLQCLFGAHKHVSPQQVRITKGSGVDQATAETVAWTEAKYKPGTLIVRTPERALYYVTGAGEAVRYSVGVGREGFQWSGHSRIVAKQEWPEWHPPQIMIEREAAKGHMLPDMMEGGPGNPLGARAMYIGGTLFRIHGTNNPASIGGAVSSGCIRMMNADVTDLFDRVKIGTPIYVYQ
jgi:lipoprotein-anchoring transpeptidase ErfK/SrfK